jgi:serine/threonine protein kinase
MVNSTISHYEILEKLGEGGMGVVYRAHDTRLGRMVAIKILPADALAKPGRKLRFIQEARSASALNHPNIVTVYEIDSCDGTDFIAMEYVPGKTLGALIGRRGLKIADVLSFSVQIAGAVAAAHAAGIIHRDLKPGNVMVTENGVAKVLDFGLAKLVANASGSPTADDPEDVETEVMEETPTTQGGQIVGTVAYMSPEQAEGKVVDARSDIFSFGAVLYEMVTGRRAFQRDSRSSTLSAIVKDQPALATGIKPDLPRDLETTLNRCLRKDPNRRFQHMGDVKIALEELKEQSDSGTLPFLGRANSAKPNPFALAAGLGAILLLSGLGAWMRFFHRAPDAVSPTMRAVPITSYRGAVDQPSFSPDGNQVAFDWTGEKEDNFDIYVKLIGPGPPLRLTTDSAIDFSPAWSPDGRSIAFGRLLGTGKYGMYVIPALGGQERKLLEGYATGDPLLPGPYSTWSGDSKWIIAPYQSSPNVPYEMSLISNETGERRRLISPAPGSLGDTMPSLAPDGKTLAFCRTSSSGTGDIYVAHLTQDLRLSGNLIPLTSENHVMAGLDFTPDGRDIIFSSDRSGKFALWRIPASKPATPQPTALFGEDAINPQLFRRGGRLIYVRQTRAETIRRIPVTGSAKDVANSRPFLASSRDEQTPQFSSDGRRVAFASNRSGPWEIWLANADGFDAAQLTSFPLSSVVQNPAWSPASGEVAFQVFSFTTNRYEIYRMPVSGGQPQRLIEGLQPSWSRDGKWIYFVSGYPASPQIWKISREGGQPVQVTRHGGAVPMESPDGKFLYYGKDLNCLSLWRMPVTGQEEEHVLDIRSGWSMYTLVGNEIYYIAGTFNRGQETHEANIESFRPATGARKHIATIEKPVPYGRSEASRVALSVSPDGRFLFYTRQDRQTSELMLVENFK